MTCFAGHDIAVIAVPRLRRSRRGPVVEPGRSPHPQRGGDRQRRIQEHRREPRFISGFIPAAPGRPPPGGSARPRHHGQRARNTRPADPDRRHPADHRPRQARLAPALASPSSATADDSATSPPSCPATASLPRSCGCATRDQPTAGPSGSTWPAATGIPSPSCRVPSAPRPAPPKKGSMTPSSFTQDPEPVADGPQPAPRPAPTCETSEYGHSV